MPKLIDLEGKQFGKLYVLYEVETHWKRGRRWMCECSCGNTYVAFANKLIAGQVKSCGCLKGKNQYV